MTRRKSASEAIAERLLLVRYCSNHWQLWVESSRSPLTYFAHGGHPKAGAASRPIAGKPGSHRYCAGPETGYMSVGAGLPAMKPVLTTQCWGGVRHGSKKQPLTMGRYRPEVDIRMPTYAHANPARACKCHAAHRGFRSRPNRLRTFRVASTYSCEARRTSCRLQWSRPSGNRFCRTGCCH